MNGHAAVTGRSDYRLFELDCTGKKGRALEGPVTRCSAMLSALPSTESSEISHEQ